MSKVRSGCTYLSRTDGIDGGRLRAVALTFTNQALAFKNCNSPFQRIETFVASHGRGWGTIERWWLLLLLGSGWSPDSAAR